MSTMVKSIKNKEIEIIDYGNKVACILPTTVGALGLLLSFIIFKDYSMTEELPQWASLYVMGIIALIPISIFWPGRKLVNYLVNKKFKMSN